MLKSKQLFNYALPKELKAMCQICINQEKHTARLHFPRQGSVFLWDLKISKLGNKFLTEAKEFFLLDVMPKT